MATNADADGDGELLGVPDGPATTDVDATVDLQ